MVAIVGLLVVQLTPDVVVLTVPDNPEQKLRDPVIDAGNGFTVTTAVV